MPEGPDAQFVFLDVQGKRWPRLRRWLFTSGVAVSLGVVLFLGSLCVKPELHLPGSVRQLQTRLRALQMEESIRPVKAVNPLWLEFTRPASANSVQNWKPVDGLPARPWSTGEIRAGFYLNGDRGSYESLRAHRGDLTHVIVEWLTVVDGEGRLVNRGDAGVQALLASGGPVFMPLLNNLTGDSWQPEAVESLANGPPSRQDRFVAEVLQRMAGIGAGGLVVDWGQLDPYYQAEITELLKRLAEALHHRGLELWLCVPMGEELRAFDLEALSPHMDRLVAVLHDENSEHDSPGPIASQEWFDGWLQAMLDYGEPRQWVVSIGSYGYDWTQGRRTAEVLSFHDVMSRAGHSGVASCRSEAPVYNPYFFYEDDGIEHVVWFLDASTFLNQLRAARARQVGGIALASLGQEDPAVWHVLRLPASAPIEGSNLTPLQVLTASEVVTHVGRGEFLTVEDSVSDGFRSVWGDSSGRMVAHYERFPSYLTLCHQGSGSGSDDQVALSFDDGPDPEWTPKILDILKAKGVKASFFLVGMRAETHPGIVRRIVEEGHEIGVHTYTHPNLASVSEDRARLEFNATQRLLETITGRSTILFRPPYTADSRPNNRAEIAPVKLAQQLGYLTVTESIDSEDWMKPGVAAILERVRQERRMGGNIILLHDAGGDRSQTVAALPALIDYLQDRGDSIASLGEMLGESPDYLMPPLKQDEGKIMRMVSGTGFRALQGAEGFLGVFVIAATTLTVLRSLLIAVLACRHRRRFEPPRGEPYEPPVTVIVAAYNEAKVIAKTLRSLLNTSYRGELEVLVVDDGSTDGTGAVVEAAALADGRVRLLSQANQGKAAALRAGIRAANHEILVMLDADTQFEYHTLANLVQPLQDEKVGAVSGHAKVGNPGTFMARCQALEYTCGFNLDRRAYDRLNCITVVPGAVSAMRRSAVMRVGGVSADTLAEDTDLTLSLHRAGYRIAYTAAAVAWTEAPETVRAFTRQRFRWAFGTLQCLWKHRDLVFNPKYGTLAWFSLPGIWFFQVLLVAVGPLVDALLAGSLWFGCDSVLLAYFAAFLLTDTFLAVLACRLEREPLRKAVLMVPMRLIYRPLLSWVIWKALFKAIQGAWVNWGKLERTASVPCRV